MPALCAAERVEYRGKRVTNHPQGTPRIPEASVSSAGSRPGAGFVTSSRHALDTALDTAPDRSRRDEPRRSQAARCDTRQASTELSAAHPAISTLNATADPAYEPTRAQPDPGRSGAADESSAAHTATSTAPPTRPPPYAAAPRTTPRRRRPAPSVARKVLHPADDAPSRVEPGEPGGCPAERRRCLARTRAPFTCVLVHVEARGHAQGRARSVYRDPDDAKRQLTACVPSNPSRRASASVSSN